LTQLEWLNLHVNSLEPELDEIYSDHAHCWIERGGIDAVFQFLLAKANNFTVKQQFSHE
jgi:hypothetical protein